MSVAGFAGRDGALPTANTHERGRGPLPVNRRLEGDGPLVVQSGRSFVPNNGAPQPIV